MISLLAVVLLMANVVSSEDLVKQVTPKHFESPKNLVSKNIINGFRSHHSRERRSSHARIFLLGQNLRAINASRRVKDIEKNRYGRSSKTHMPKRSSY